MNKALQILKNCKDRGQKRAGGLDLREAIAELEEAMQPKTCVGCKYVSQGRYRVPCYTCARILHDEYEPKDNA